MKHLGFDDKWISWTSALYRGAETSILVSGKRLPKFPLELSVQQGCPLEPYLYLFVVDVLAAMMSNPLYGVNDHKLPDGSFVTLQSFADDTALFLKVTRENLQRAAQVLDIFCQASEAKINWSKTFAIWISYQPRI